MAADPHNSTRKIGRLLTIGPVTTAESGAFWRRCRASRTRHSGVRSERWARALSISEMTACAALAAGKRDAQRRVTGQGAGLHVVQLAGCEAHWMAEGARIAEGAGAAIIDINMGCPAKHVTNGESGSALMRDLDHALTLIDAVVQAVKVPVTLKMRLGWDDRSRNAPELARRAEAGRRGACHRARPHALPILQGPRRLGGGARRQGRRVDPGRRQRRHRKLRRRRLRRSRPPAPTR